MPLAPHNFDDLAFRMFQDEWIRQRGSGAAQRIAIVDDKPEEQYLYPEFVLARQALVTRGVDAIIADATSFAMSAAVSPSRVSRSTLCTIG